MSFGHCVFGSDESHCPRNFSPGLRSPVFLSVMSLMVTVPSGENTSVRPSDADPVRNDVIYPIFI